MSAGSIQYLRFWSPRPLPAEHRVETEASSEECIDNEVFETSWEPSEHLMAEDELNRRLPLMGFLPADVQETLREIFFSTFARAEELGAVPDLSDFKEALLASGVKGVDLEGLVPNFNSLGGSPTLGLAPAMTVVVKQAAAELETQLQTNRKNLAAQRESLLAEVAEKVSARLFPSGGGKFLITSESDHAPMRVTLELPAYGHTAVTRDAVFHGQLPITYGPVETAYGADELTQKIEDAVTSQSGELLKTAHKYLTLFRQLTDSTVDPIDSAARNFLNEEYEVTQVQFEKSQVQISGRLKNWGNRQIGVALPFDNRHADSWLRDIAQTLKTEIAFESGRAESWKAQLTLQDELRPIADELAAQTGHDIRISAPITKNGATYSSSVFIDGEQWQLTFERAFDNAEEVKSALVERLAAIEIMLARRDENYRAVVTAVATAPELANAREQVWPHLTVSQKGRKVVIENAMSEAGRDPFFVSLDLVTETIDYDGTVWLTAPEPEKVLQKLYDAVVSGPFRFNS